MTRAGRRLLLVATLALPTVAIAVQALALVLAPTATATTTRTAGVKYDYDHLAACAQSGYRNALRQALPAAHLTAEAQDAFAPVGAVTRFSIAAKAGAGAENAANAVRLRAQLAGQEIAGGHAFTKHVVSGGQFPGVRTRAEFAEVIENVVAKGEMRSLSGGRTAYWRRGVVVIRNPRAADGGTAFVPRDGRDYFLGLH